MLPIVGGKATGIQIQHTIFCTLGSGTVKLLAILNINTNTLGIGHINPREA